MVRNALALAAFLITATATSTPLPPELATDLSGTSWGGMGTIAYTVYNLEKDGSLSYRQGSSFFRDGAWKQTGTTVYFEINDRFFLFKGTLRGGELVGQAWNVKGESWDYHLRRQPFHAVPRVDPVPDDRRP